MSTSKGAEGIPRDFLVLFNSVARVHRHSVAERWTTVGVQDAIRQRSVLGQDDIEFRSVTSPAESVPAFARQGFRAYLVDYGLWLDWDRTRVGDEVTHEESALPTEEDFDAWQVDPSPIERDDRITCPHCGSVFTADEAAYVRKRLCPLCFERVDDQPGLAEGSVEG